MYYCHIYNRFGEDAENRRQSVIAEAVMLKHIPRIGEYFTIRVKRKYIGGTVLKVSHEVTPEGNDNDDWKHSIVLIIDTLENDSST
jgi:hypothetical protein